MTPRACEREGCERLLPSDAPAQRRFCTHRCQWYHWRVTHSGDQDITSARKSLDTVMEGYALLTEQGATRTEVAEALGIGYNTLTRALVRARAAGDPRAGESRPYTVRSYTVKRRKKR